MAFCPRKRERPGSRPGLPEHRRLPAPHKSSTASVAGLRTDARPACRSAPVHPLLTVIANPALLRCWRWLSATSTSTLRGLLPGATTRARAGRGRRPSAAAEWTVVGFCRCAAVSAASCPSTSPSASIRWPAISPSGFSPGLSCRHALAGSLPLRSPPRSARSFASCLASSASRSTRRWRFSSGSATADREAGGLDQTALTGSGAASVWTGWWASFRGPWRSGCRPRPARTAAGATTARTSTEAFRARRRCVRVISRSSRPRAGCGTRATRLPARMRRRRPASWRS
jgi:hypothetical protein